MGVVDDGGGVGFSVWVGVDVLMTVGLDVDEGEVVAVGEGEGVGVCVVTGDDVGVQFGLKAIDIEGLGE